jgi:dephospho-CoA kinase
MGRGFRVGLTGGIASGKSTVAELFAARGVAVIDSDVIARQVVAPGGPLLQQLVAEFGAQILQPDGGLDRKALRRMVFAETDARRRLEALLHPAIRAEMERQSGRAAGPYQILVIPLLIETGRQTPVDRVLVVDCPPSVQKQRLSARDRSSDAEVAAILAAQVSREQRLSAADDVIVNDGDLQQLSTAVAALHQRYCRLAHESSKIPS